MHGLLNYMGLNRRPPSHSVSDTAKAKTDVSTFVHAFHSQPLRKLLRSPTSVSYRLPFPALGPGDPARKKHYPLRASFLPVTVRIFTCYSPSPPLSGTKSGHWPPWLFSLVTRSFYLLNSSLCITPAKSPLVEPTSCQIDRLPHLPKEAQAHYEYAVAFTSFLLPHPKCPTLKSLSPL